MHVIDLGTGRPTIMPTEVGRRDLFHRKERLMRHETEYRLLLEFAATLPDLIVAFENSAAALDQLDNANIYEHRYFTLGIRPIAHMLARVLLEVGDMADSIGPGPNDKVSDQALGIALGLRATRHLCCTTHDYGLLAHDATEHCASILARD